MGHILIAADAEAVVSDEAEGAEQVSVFSENRTDLEELGGFTLFSFVIACLPVSRWGLK